MAGQAPMRASDQDRQEAVLALSDQFAEGRLDRDEFDRRQGQAQEAVYLHDLDPLFADLPGRAAPTTRAEAPSTAPGRRPHPAAIAAFGLLSAASTVVLIALAVGAIVSGHPLWLLVPLVAFALARRARRRALAHAAIRSGATPGRPMMFGPPMAFAAYDGPPRPPWHGPHHGRP
jgi:hypothetical protein